MNAEQIDARLEFLKKQTAEAKEAQEEADNAYRRFVEQKEQTERALGRLDRKRDELDRRVAAVVFREAAVVRDEQRLAERVSSVEQKEREVNQLVELANKRRALAVD